MSQVFKFDIPKTEIQLNVHGKVEKIRVPPVDEVMEYEDKVATAKSTKEIVAASKQHLLNLGVSKESLAVMDWDTMRRFITFVNGEKKS